MADMIATSTAVGGYRGTLGEGTGGRRVASMRDTDPPHLSRQVHAQAGLHASSVLGAAGIVPVVLGRAGLVAGSVFGATAGALPPAPQLALGAWNAPVAPTWNHDHAANYLALVGVKPPLVHWYSDLVNSPTWNQYNDITLATSEQVVPLITYELWDYTKGATQAGFTNAAILAGAHDTVITAFATAAKNWGRPFLLRPFHEMTGIWYPWACGTGNPNGNSPASLIAAWRHVWQLFRNAGAANAKFVWCPSIIVPGPLVDMASCYPGDAYVDWLGLDGYSWPTGSTIGWHLFTDLFGPSYTHITGIGPQPLLVCETGVATGTDDKSGWIADMAATAAGAFPRLKAIVWFNSADVHNWRFDDTSPHLAAYQTAARTYALSGGITP